MAILFTLSVPEGLEIQENTISANLQRVISLSTVDDSNNENETVDQYECTWYLIDKPTTSNASIILPGNGNRSITLNAIDVWGTYRIFCVVNEIAAPANKSEENPLKSREEHFVNITVKSTINQLEKPANHQRNWKAKYDKLVDVVDNTTKKIGIIQVPGSNPALSLTLPTSVSANTYLKTDNLGQLTFSSINTSDIEISNLGLNNLSDVDTTSIPPENGQALVYNNNVWAPGDVAGGSSISLSDISASSTAASGGGSFSYDNSTGVFSYTPPDLTSYLTSFNLVDDETPQLAGDLDGQGFRVLFANMYATEGDLPSAATYHGMFAHVHATGKAYFAHGGNWIKLALETDVPTNTDNISEGSNNLYYTDARANERFTIRIAEASLQSLDKVNGNMIPSDGQVLRWSNSNNYWTSSNLDITISDLTNFLDTNLSTVSENDDTLASAKAIKAYVDANSGGGGGATDSITENNAKVEVFDDNSAGAAVIKFSVDPSNSGTPTEVWNINESGHLIPQANATYDIGSSERKVRHLFLSDNSLKFASGSSANSDLVEYRLGRSSNGDLTWETYSLGDNPNANPATPTISHKLAYNLSFDNVKVVSVDSSDIGLSNFGNLSYNSNNLTLTGNLDYDSQFYADGVALSLNNRVLVLDRTNSTENGIYKLTQTGSPLDENMQPGSPWVFTRDDDFISSKITYGKKVFIEEGNVYKFYNFIYSGSDNPTIDTDSITFLNQFSKFSNIKENSNNILIKNNTIIKPESSASVDLGEFSNSFDDFYSNTGHFKQQFKLNTGSNEKTIQYIKDEDDMSSNSDVSLATQQSIKAYVDNKIPSIAYISATLESDVSGSEDQIGEMSPFGFANTTPETSSSNITLNNSGEFVFSASGNYEIDYTFTVNNYYGDPNITLSFCSLNKNSSNNITEILSLNNVILLTSGAKETRTMKSIHSFNANDRLLIKLGGPSNGDGGVKIYAGTSIIIKKIS